MGLNAVAHKHTRIWVVRWAQKQAFLYLLPLKQALKLSNSGAQRGDELRNVSNFMSFDGMKKLKFN